MNIPLPSSPHRPVFIWLAGTCFLIWIMIMLGGATRLTHAGLSIVEWKPLTGIIPPLNGEDWNREFNAYKQFPEYQQINKDMNLKAFQFIYLMEYMHRLLGRFIGLWFALPALFFWKTHRLSSPFKKRILIVLVLGVFQGFIGWYMIKSGLVKDPAVSHYRLTTHLALAVLLYAILLWTTFGLLKPPGDCSVKFSSGKIKVMGLLCCLSLALTILYGGLVAGLKAGLIYNTFPLMEKQFLPAEWNFYQPLWLNLLENPALVQWIHRWLGIISFCLITLTASKSFLTSQNRQIRLTVLMLTGFATVQVGLGIATLLLHVPILLGTLHQGNAIVVLSFGIYLVYLSSQTELKENSLGRRANFVYVRKRLKRTY
jgi:cytochrome c oxidase assembly protein subunit 15